MPDTAETAHITAPRSMAHLLRTTLMAVGILSLLLSVVGDRKSTRLNSSH